MDLTFTLKIDGVLTNADDGSVVLEDEAGEYGARKATSLETVVPAGTAMLNPSVGEYLYTYTRVDTDDIEYVVKFDVSGVTSYYHGVNSIGELSNAIGRYTSLDRMRQEFGTSNIQLWAKYEDNENTADLSLRIYKAIEYAEEFIDGFLRYGRYSIPFTPPIPVPITEVATIIAGVNLYSARGIEDVDDVTGNHRLTSRHKYALNLLKQIKFGAVSFANTAKTYPEVVTEES